MGEISKLSWQHPGEAQTPELAASKNRINVKSVKDKQG